MNSSSPKEISQRFRGYLPIVVDVETAGFNPKKDALLELAAVSLVFNEAGILVPDQTWHYHIQPFEGANLDPKALDFNGIIPDHPFRFAKKEKDALDDLFLGIRQELKDKNCQRAIMVAHNAAFDLSFLQAAVKRTEISRNPFHAFSTLDTASLSALAFGQTVLAKALRAADLGFDPEQAHSALYDAKQTALLFCHIVNQWDQRDT